MSELKTKIWKVFSSWRVVVLVFLALFVPLFRPVVAIIDPVGYYAWPHSVLIDGDLDVADEFARFGMDAAMPTTPTGYLHNQWPAGSGWIWLPAMGVAHVAVLAGSHFGVAIPADGYSWPYAWAASLTSAFAGLAAVLLVYFLARRFFGNFVSLLSAMAVWLATPLVFYQYHQPLMSHANDALLNALFVLLWLEAREGRRRNLSAFGLGVVVGAAVWVRAQNAILLFVVLLELGYDLLAQVRSGGKYAGLRPLLARGGLLVAGFGCLFVPLMIFWHRVYGAWIVNTYQASAGGTFDWRARHLLDVLISTDRGLFVWAPITVLCVFGILRLYIVERRVALVLGSVAFFQWYLISSWSIWAGGDAFGPRFWVALTPLWCLGLAALLDYLDTRTPYRRIALAGIMGVLIAWNFLLMLQFSLGTVPPSGPVDLDVMLRNQFSLAPQLLTRVVARAREWFAP